MLRRHPRCAANKGFLVPIVAERVKSLLERVQSPLPALTQAPSPARDARSDRSYSDPTMATSPLNFSTPPAPLPHRFPCLQIVRIAPGVAPANLGSTIADHVTSEPTTDS